jgi:spermidine/putrescine transport system permease protein
MRRLLQLNAILIYIFLYAPIVILILFSFNNSRLNAVWRGFTLDWYKALIQDEAIIRACKNSLIVSLSSTFISTIIGTITAFGLERYKFRLKSIYTGLIYLPIIIPDLVMAISLLIFYTKIRLPLGLMSIIVAHVAFNISFVTVVVRARLRGFDKTLEEAAMDLGANEFTTFRKVTLPLIAPGVLGGALLAFTLSIDDFVITYFTAGTGSDTLPLRIFSMVRFGITPEINAVSSILLLNSIIFVLLSLKFQRREV